MPVFCEGKEGYKVLGVLAMYSISFQMRGLWALGSGLWALGSGLCCCCCYYAVVVVQVLSTNTVLTSLDMDDNGFSDHDASSGVSGLALALKENSALTSLNGICVDAERECNLCAGGGSGGEGGNLLQLHESMFVWLRLCASSVVVLDMAGNNLCLLNPGLNPE